MVLDVITFKGYASFLFMLSCKVEGIQKCKLKLDGTCAIKPVTSQQINKGCHLVV